MLIYIKITLHITFDFLIPKLSVRFYFPLFILPVITMPKLTVTEYGNSYPFEHKVRVTENT